MASRISILRSLQPRSSLRLSSHRQFSIFTQNRIEEQSTTASSLSSQPPPPQSSLSRYHVARVLPSHQLPIYTLSKGHGTLHLTRVKRISGDTAGLAKDLQSHLGITQDKDCVVKNLTGHIEIKGRWTKEINEFLVAKGF